MAISTQSARCRPFDLPFMLVVKIVQARAVYSVTSTQALTSKIQAQQQAFQGKMSPQSARYRPLDLPFARAVDIARVRAVSSGTPTLGDGRWPPKNRHSNRLCGWDKPLQLSWLLTFNLPLARTVDRLQARAVSPGTPTLTLLLSRAKQVLPVQYDWVGF